MVSLRDTIELANLEWERLKEFLSNLSPDDWAKPSPCDRWEVADVVGHLTWVGEFYGNIFSRALQGNYSPPEDSPGGSANQWATNDEFFAQRAIRTRVRWGEELLQYFQRAYGHLFHLFSQLGPEDLDKPCYLPGGTRHLQYLPVMTVQELAVHSWDVRSVIEPSAHLSPETLPVLMERIAQRRLPNLRIGSGASGPERYRFQLTGPVPGEHDVLVESSASRVEPAGAAVPTDTFRCDASTFMLLMYGRLTPSAAIASGQLEPEKDQ